MWRLHHADLSSNKLTVTRYNTWVTFSYFLKVTKYSNTRVLSTCNEVTFSRFTCILLLCKICRLLHVIFSTSHVMLQSCDVISWQNQINSTTCRFAPSLSSFGATLLPPSRFRPTCVERHDRPLSSPRLNFFSFCNVYTVYSIVLWCWYYYLILKRLQ